MDGADGHLVIAAEDGVGRVLQRQKLLGPEISTALRALGADADELRIDLHALQLHGLLEHGDAAEGDAVADAGDALVAALLQVLHAHDDAAVFVEMDAVKFQQGIVFRRDQHDRQAASVHGADELIGHVFLGIHDDEQALDVDAAHGVDRVEQLRGLEIRQLHDERIALRGEKILRLVHQTRVIFRRDLGDDDARRIPIRRGAAAAALQSVAELVRRLEDLFRHFPADLFAAVEPAGDRGDAHAKLLCNVFQVCHGMHRLSPDIIT